MEVQTIADRKRPKRIMETMESKSKGERIERHNRNRKNENGFNSADPSGTGRGQTISSACLETTKKCMGN